MADLNGFDANQVEPTTDLEPIPAGKYAAAIVESEMKPTKAGTGHYLQLTFQVIDAIEAWDLGFHLGNVVKYVARAAHKGQRLPDLKKARWRLDRQIARLEQNCDGPSQRTCLKCSDPFDSSGPANRICPACQQRNARLPRMTEAQLQRQRGEKRRNGEVVNDLWYNDNASDGTK